MPKDDLAGWKARAGLDLFGNGLADADIAQHMVAERIESCGFRLLRTGTFDALADDDDAPSFAPRIDRFEMRAHRRDIDFHFGDQNPISSACDRRPEGYPAGVPPHNFHDDHTVM